MNKRHGLVGCLALALSVSAFGCGDGDGSGDESISGVIPGELFAGRTGEVLIIGNNTSWEQDVQVSLGEGVTVDSVTVASPTALMVTATADATAEPGVREVLVDDLSFAEAFEVTTPVVVKSLQGQTAQGSIAIVTVQNLDFANPFDTTTIGDGFFTPIEYINVAVTAGDGATAQISSVEPFAMEFLLLTDVTASPGVVDLEVLSGPAGTQQSFRYPAAYEIEARDAQAIDSGEPATGSIDEPFQSQLYTVTADDLSVINFNTSAESPDAAPAFALLPASGSFAELITYSSVAQFVGSDTYYLVYWDNSGMSGYSYRIDSNVQAALALTEDEPNDTRAAAQKPETMPAVVQSANMTLTDEDWIRVRIPAGSPDQSIHVFTYGTDPLTDTKIEIYLSNGTTQIAESSDQGYHENVASDPMGPGTYYVKVFGSPGYFDPAHDTYSVAVVLE
jgi:hypothetical protein